MAHRFLQQRKISDILNDKNEFPTLSEVSKKSKTKESSQSGNKLLSYSFNRLKISHDVENVPRRFSIGKKTFSEFIPGVPIVVDTFENTPAENTSWIEKCEIQNSTEAVLKEFPETNEKVQPVSNAWSRVVSSAPQKPKCQQHLPSKDELKSGKKLPTNCKGKNSSPACKETTKKNVSVESSGNNAWSHAGSSTSQNPKYQQHLPNENTFPSGKKVPTNYKGKNSSLACEEMPKKNASIESSGNNAWSQVAGSARRNPKYQQHFPNETTFQSNKKVPTNCKGKNSPTACEEIPKSNASIESGDNNAWSHVASSAWRNPKCQQHLPNKNVSKSNIQVPVNCKGKSPSLLCKEMPKTNVSVESDAEGEVRKKRKRKSKVKRQSAMRSGKISLVTPEIHLKITNQTKYSNNSVSNDISMNIHDSEEYPELGRMVDLKKIKPEKKNVHSEKKSLNVIISEHELSENCEQLEESADDAENAPGLQETSLKGAKSVEVSKEGKNDQKTVVHPNDPITISFFDILAASKTKENQEKRGPVVPISSSKSSSKVIHSRPHNLLDSKPVAKRGKEREVPKAKKPTLMKKIILMDRKTRKEQLIQLRNSLNESKQDSPQLSQENNESEVNHNASHDIKSTPLNPPYEKNMIEEQPAISLENGVNEINCKAEEEITLTHEDKTSNSDDEYGYHVDSNEDPEQSNNYDPPTDHERSVKARSMQIADAITFKHIQMLNSMFGFTMSSKDVDVNENSCCSDEERLKASKILIHTRNFREYCNHLPSQEIDDAVCALLADLVRFQDRMHQKDPVKARIKRRLTCGIKEVKKHLKLRKVKCVILATDVENVQTEGGLNDVLCDLKQSAADHQIPCVFALRKKRLGKLCHKPVAVSCIGIFNYEGSEVNFKKMMELLNQSKEDYEQILKGVKLKLSDEDIKHLIRARLTAPESLMEIRTDILRKTLLENPKIEDMPNIEVVDN